MKGVLRGSTARVAQLVFVFGLVVSCLPAARGAEWSVQWYDADAPPLYAVHFIDTLRGWAVGGSGSVLYTTDGGATWTSRTAGIYDLNAVRFVSATTGCAAGPQIYRSTDGGASWALRSNPSGKTIEALCFFGTAEGWAVGQQGAILHTADGGSVWSTQTSGVTAGLYAVDFISAVEGWAIGYATVLHTTNGGGTWVNLNPGIADGLYGADFVSATEGWAVGTAQKIRHTTNGGASWTLQYSNPWAPYDLQDICMASATEGWAVGRMGLILRTTDGGGTWEEVFNPAAPRHMYGVSFPTPEYGWAVGVAPVGYNAAVVRYGPSPGTVLGQVWLDGRTEYGGTYVWATPPGGPTNVTVTGASGGFAVDAPEVEFTVRGDRAGYLAAEKTGLVVAPETARRLPPVRLPGGDANNDGRVDTNDLAVVASNLNGSVSSSDLNGDGSVDVVDMVLTAKNLGGEEPIEWPTRGTLHWWREGTITVSQARSPYEQAGRFSPDVVAADGGGYRMYYTGTDGTNARILSMYSTSGTNWTPDAGVRVEPWDEYVDVYSPNVVNEGGGLWRMYFSARTATPVADILSATSMNGLDWEVESGLRIAHGGTYDTLIAQSPALFRNTNGTAHAFGDGYRRMLYNGHDGTNLYILAAQSTNGLSWEKGAVVYGPMAGMAAGEGLPPAYVMNLGSSFQLTAIVDCEVVQEEDGTYRVYFSIPGDEGDGGGSTNSISAGIVSLWLKDGVTPIGPIVQEIMGGLLGGADCAADFAPAFAFINGMRYTFYSGAGTNGNSDIMSGIALDEDIAPAFELLEVRHVSVAQVELTVFYDMSPVPPYLRAGRDFCLGASATTNGVRIANILTRFEPVTNETGTVTLLLEYYGDRPLITDAFEVSLYGLFAGGLLPEEPTLVCWLAMQVGGDTSRKLAVLLDQHTWGGLLFSDNVDLASEIDDILSGHSVGAAATAELPARGRQIFAEEDEAPSIYSSTVFEERTLWLPGVTGDMKVRNYSEAPGARAKTVSDGPYLSASVLYRYKNVWADSATFAAEVYDNDGELVDHFAVKAPTIKPTVGAGSEDSGSMLGRDVAQIRISYTNTAAVPNSTIRLVMKRGDAEIADAWLTDPDRPGPLHRYRKTWRPLAQVEFVTTSVQKVSTDLIQIAVDYDLDLLPNSSARPSIIAEALTYHGDPWPVGQFRSGSCQTRQLLSAGKVPLRYVGESSIGPTTSGLRLTAVLRGVVLAQTDIAYTNSWSRRDVGHVGYAPGRTSVRQQPIRGGSTLALDLRARCWTSSRTDGLLRVELLRGLQACEDFECEPVPVPSVNDREDGRQWPTSNETFQVTATYTGAATDFVTTGFRVLLEDPETGEVIDRKIETNQPFRWNPESVGTINFVLIKPPPNAWEGVVLVDYDYASYLPGETACFMVEWYEWVLQPLGGGRWRYVAEPHRRFTQDFPTLSEGVGQQRAIPVTHTGPSTIETDGLTVSLVANAGSGWRVLDEFTEVDEDREWEPPPHYQIELSSIVSLVEDSEHLTVNVGYRLTNDVPGHTYSIRVQALQDLSGEMGTVEIAATEDISDPGAAVPEMQYLPVGLTYTGPQYCLRTDFVQASLLDNGEEVSFQSGPLVRAIEPYSREWNDDVPGMITTPVIIPIATNESAFVAEYEFYGDAQNLRPMLELYSGDTRLYPASNTEFFVECAPFLISSLTNGSHGAITGRIHYEAENVWNRGTIDRLNVGFVQADEEGVPLSDPIVVGSYEAPFEWSTWDDVARTNNFSFENFEVERPSTDVVHVSVDYECPQYYEMEASGGLMLKAFPWAGLTPLFQPPTNVVAALQDGDDESVYDDFRELLFTSADLPIGVEPIPNTQGGNVDAPAAGTTTWHGPTGGFGGGSAMESLGRATGIGTGQEPMGGSGGGILVGYIGRATGTFETDLKYTPIAGETSISMVSFVFYRQDGTPVYSRTFTVPPESQRVIALDKVAPETSTGHPMIRVDDRNVALRSTLYVVVSCAKSSDAQGYGLWLERFSHASTSHPYYPFDLVDMRALVGEGKGSGGTLDDGMTPYVAISNGVTSVLFVFRRTDFAVSGNLRELMEFNMGVVPDGTSVTNYEYDLDMDWEQYADIDVPEAHYQRGDYCNQVDVWGVDYLINTSMGLHLPAYLFAVPLSNGVPIQGISCRPARMEDSDGQVARGDKVVLEYDFSDTPADRVTADQLLLLIGEEKSPKAGVISTRLETLSPKKYWLRPPVRLVVGDIRDVPDGCDVDVTVFVDYPSDPEIAPVYDSLGPNEFVGVRLRGLLFGEDPPGGVSTESSLIWVGDRNTQPSSKQTTGYIRYSGGTTAATVINEIGLYASVYEYAGGLDGSVEKRALAYTVVDHVTKLVNANSFIVGMLDSLDINDDGDGAVRGMGEDILNTIGVSADESSPDMFKDDAEGTLGRLEWSWPVEIDKNSRWCKTEDPDTWTLNLPVFSTREYVMKDSLGMAAALADDDTIPSFVTSLIDLLFKIAELVAQAFGQTEISAALELVNQFVDKLVAMDAMPDQIETGGVILERDQGGWGVNLDDEDAWAAAVQYKGDGSGMTPHFRTQRILLPAAPKPITVTLKQIKVHDDSESWPSGDGDLFGKCRVYDGMNPPRETRIPGSGTKNMGDGSSWDVSQETFSTIFSTTNVGPFVYIEVVLWDEDDPSICNDNDNLGVFTWIEYIHEDGWAPKTLNDISSREGCVEVTVEITDE